MKDILSTDEAATYCGISASWLRHDRSMAKTNGQTLNTPPFIEVSKRKTLYRRSDLDSWLEAKKLRGQEDKSKARKEATMDDKILSVFNSVIDTIVSAQMISSPCVDREVLRAGVSMTVLANMLERYSAALQEASKR